MSLVKYEGNAPMGLDIKEDQRSPMMTNTLEIGAFMVMAIASLAGLNDDRTHVVGTNVPLWIGGFAALVLSAPTAGLILVGACLTIGVFSRLLGMKW